MLGRNRFFQTVCHGLGLAFVRDTAGNETGFQNRGNGQRQRLSRHFIDRCKMSFTHLLLPAALVRCDNMNKSLGLEIGGGIVESEMAVLTNSDARNIDPAVGK